MGELRKDYILDRWVIISPKRGKRPHELIEKVEIKEEKCVFCPGNEHMTPPEKGRFGDKSAWKVRWFANLFAAVVPEGISATKTENRFFTWANNLGVAEIIVDTADHKRQLGELSTDELALVLKAYNTRIDELSKVPFVKYVSVFKNHGLQAGTSLVHSHSQVFALPFVPPAILEKRVASKRFLSCPYCDVIQAEKDSTRRVAENNDFVAFAPYASRFNYEVWVFPKPHVTKFSKLNFSSLAEILSPILHKIASSGWSFNLFFHYDPADVMHAHVEVCPRIATWAGFEISTDVIINSVPPEEAAAFYRGDS